MNKDVKKIIKKNKYRADFYKLKRKKDTSASADDKKKRLLFGFLQKVLISTIILLFLLICKKNDKIRFIHDKTLRNMNFMKIKHFFSTQLSSLFPTGSDPEKYVGNITINMEDTAKYRNGLVIQTAYSEPVLSCVDGIVIRIYNDDDLGRVVVIQDVAGYEYHYGYLDDIKMKIYNSVKYGDLLGIGITDESLNGKYYLEIKNGADYLDVIDTVNNS